MADEESPDMVEIIVKTIGRMRPSPLRVPSAIKVCELKALIAAERQLPAERLKLVLKGKALHDKNNSDGDASVVLENGDSLMVAVIPKPPAQHLREEDDSDEDELKFHIPASTSWLKRRIFLFLHEKLRFPDILLIPIFSISLKTWIAVILWFLLAPVAQKWDLGPVYILATGFLIILLNLGKRRQGDLSAYSVFNEDFRELPGTLNADRLDRDIRAGQF